VTLAAAAPTPQAMSRNELIERHLPLATKLARRYARNRDTAEELRQVACVALVKAVDRFDPERGVPFASFATPTILGELKRHLRDNRWAVHVPRDLQELAQRVAREADRLTTQLGRTPTMREVADALGVSVEQAVEARVALGGLDAWSLAVPVGQDADGEETARDRIETIETGFKLVEDREAVGHALARLPARQRFALRLRFAEDMTQAEIADVLGVSQMQVSRILRRSLSRLRTLAEAA
jgi:RNA polymerase sigma-B factor